MAVFICFHKLLIIRWPNESKQASNQQLKTRKQEILDKWEQSSIQGSLEHDRREKDVIDNGITWNSKYYPYMNKTILDVGCGTGFCSRELRDTYKKAKVTAKLHKLFCPELKLNISTTLPFL